MKRGKLDPPPPFMLPNRLTLLQVFMAVMLVYLLFMSFEIPLAFRVSVPTTEKATTFGFLSDALPVPLIEPEHPTRPETEPKVSTLSFNESFNGEFSELHNVAKQAWVAGRNLWEEIESGKIENLVRFRVENGSDSCPNSVSVSGSGFKGVMVLPCGLTLWSHLTVVGTPRWAHAERDPKIAVVKEGDEAVMVSQFMMELQGLKAVENEEPPRILHFNPRLKGDWSGKPVIEMNTCYRMQWGNALRCEGWKSRADEETGE